MWRAGLGVVLLVVWVVTPACWCVKGGPRSKSSECRSNLKSWFVAEHAYRAERDTFSPRIADVGFNPDRGNRYAYFASRSGTVQDRSAATLAETPTDTGVAADTFKFGSSQAISRARALDLHAVGCRIGHDGGCDDITALCAGNLDGDPDVDLWSISTRARTAPNGESIPAGVPYHELFDVKEN